MRRSPLVSGISLVIWLAGCHAGTVDRDHKGVGALLLEVPAVGQVVLVGDTLLLHNCVIIQARRIKDGDASAIAHTKTCRHVTLAEENL